MSFSQTYLYLPTLYPFKYTQPLNLLLVIYSSNFTIVSPDTAISLAIGLIGILVSMFGALIGFLTLRATATTSSVYIFLLLYSMLQANYPPLGSAGHYVPGEERIVHRHEHKHVFSLSPLG